MARARAASPADVSPDSEHAPPEAVAEPPEARNEVVLWGRLSAPAEQRELPSGDVIVTLRVVVRRTGRPPRRRPPVDGTARPPGVDTIDIVCWSALTRRAALRLREGEEVEVEGALRRRFFGGPGGRQSRYEVEALALRRRGGRRSRDT